MIAEDRFVYAQTTNKVDPESVRLVQQDIAKVRRTQHLLCWPTTNHRYKLQGCQTYSLVLWVCLRPMAVVLSERQCQYVHIKNKMLRTCVGA